MIVELRVVAGDQSSGETFEVCKKAAELYEGSAFSRYTASVLVTVAGGATIEVWGSGVEWTILRSDHDGEMVRTDATLVFILLTEVRPKYIVDVVMRLNYGGA